MPIPGYPKAPWWSSSDPAPDIPGLTIPGVPVGLGPGRFHVMPTGRDLVHRLTAWLAAVRLQLIFFAGVLALGWIAFLLRNPLGPRGVAVFGVVCFLGLCFSFSRNPKAVKIRTIATGLALQVGLALLVLKTALGQHLFGGLGAAIKKFLEFTDEGSRFVFGVLADPAGMESAFGVGRGFVFAFRALPTIVFISAFFAILYYLGILQWVVRIIARVMMAIMGVSGAESLNAAANIFMGQTEAPLIVKPYIARLTESELLALMMAGFATISAGIMAVYIDLGASAEMLLAGSVMAAPASLLVAKILVPETEKPETAGHTRITTERKEANVIDTMSQGASDGMKLALNVAAMLIAFLAMIAMIDFLLGYLDLSLSRLFGWTFSPFAFLTGVPAGDISGVADLLGTKLVANEFVAYVNLTGPYMAPGGLSPRGLAIATVALCGFANFGSVGIQIGGIGGIAPERRADLSRLGIKALAGGFMVTLLNAALVGIMIE
jgi:concentrative nucleoside transporter, CNT family